jgi:hypothetical protein
VDLTGSELGPVAGFREHSGEPSGFGANVLLT